MEKQIYIVVATCPYDEYERKWNVIAYDDKDAAERHVRFANEWQIAHIGKNKDVNPFDANPDWNSRETEYSCEPVPLGVGGNNV